MCNAHGLLKPNFPKLSLFKTVSFRQIVTHYRTTPNVPTRQIFAVPDPLMVVALGELLAGAGASIPVAVRRRVRRAEILKSSINGNITPDLTAFSANC
jgi:hypothetical protein